ncbi:RodZ domain-containing protein [Alkalilimnicola ehrlichii]|uniref:RodZ domain-containing protein n=1 Tax=Alkalilimnicola ehrlichii TaxID=351052 RepID=UPI003B9F09A5
MSSDHDSPLSPDHERDPGRGGETPGQLLARAREARGLSRKAAADALNLPLRTLEALEGDDYDNLPPLTFVKGYLRGYAQLLEIDPDRLREALARLDLERPASGAQQQPGQGSSVTGGGTSRGVSLQGRRLRGWLLGVSSVVVVAVIAVLAWLWLVENGVSGDSEAPPVAEEGTAPSEEAPAEAVVSDELAERRLPEAVDEVVPEASVPDDTGADVSVPETLEPPVVPEVEAEPEPAVAEPEPEPVPDGLVLHISGTTWLEVRDEDGERLMVGNYQGEETHQLQGEGPFALVIGNADAVRVEFQGDAVDLAPHTRGNVARLTIP